MSANEYSKTIIIQPGKKAYHYWKDLWHYRELFYFLSWRDILVRYKQTLIGVSWSLLRPLLTMIVFTVVFGKIAKLPSDGIPYPILVFAAMLPWQFFSSSFSEAGNSLISNSNLLTKLYFPRIIVPASSIIVSFVDFAISFVILAGLMFWYRFIPDLKLLVLPFFLLMAFITSLGAGLWISSLNVKYRDFRYIIPFIVQFGLYLSPVGFSSNVVPEQWRLLYSMNPMVGVIDGFRWAICGTHLLYVPGLICSGAVSILLLIIGISYFRKTEKEFADII